MKPICGGLLTVAGVVAFVDAVLELQRITWSVITISTTVVEFATALGCAIFLGFVVGYAIHEYQRTSRL
jgi:hypothetical protein